MAESLTESLEFRTILNCSTSLEYALKEDRDVVYFLLKEGFITEELSDEILKPTSMLSAAEKAGKLVTRIRDRVKLSVQEYHNLIDYFSDNKRKYGPIVDKLGLAYAQLGE